MPFDLFSQEMVLCILTLFFAYLVFGMAGFGSALIATPVLAMYLPLNMIVPILALIDLSASLINLVKDGKKADYQEIKWIIPLMIVGSLIGAAILLKTRPDILVLLLGIFVICYVMNSFFSKKGQSHFSKALVVPFSLIGGIFSALFGSGGFIYAMYLSSRIADKQQFRITQMTLIGFSTLTRVIIFLFMGGLRQSGYFIDGASFFTSHASGYLGWSSYYAENIARSFFKNHQYCYFYFRSCLAIPLFLCFINDQLIVNI
ncbi:putative membrane protein YfcA [Providencia alcalifaciens]|nr:putative membrane protein YfcA [Providencia alcalifaciens]